MEYDLARPHIMRLLSPRIVAQRLGIHRNSVYGLLASGALPYCMIGQRKMVPEHELESWIMSNTVPASTGADGLPSSGAEVVSVESKLERSANRMQKRSADA